jgi:hypothetical protein
MDLQGIEPWTTPMLREYYTTKPQARTNTLLEVLMKGMASAGFITQRKLFAALMSAASGTTAHRCRNMRRRSLHAEEYSQMGLDVQLELVYSELFRQSTFSRPAIKLRCQKLFHVC